MPIDPRIALGVEPIKIESPVSMMTNVMQLRNAQKQYQLQQQAEQKAQIEEGIKTISGYSNKADALTGLYEAFESDKIDKQHFDQMLGVLKRNPDWATAQQELITPLLSAKDRIELQTQQKQQQQFKDIMGGGLPPTSATVTPAPTNALAPVDQEQALFNQLNPPQQPAGNNALAPAPTTMATPDANAVDKQILALYALGTPQAVNTANFLKSQLTAQAEAKVPKTELGKLRAERQRALDAGDTEAVKLYDAASRIEAGQDVSAKDKANLNLDWAKYYWSQKQNSPEYKAQVAAAEAEGKDKVTFNAKLPSVINNATQAIGLIDTMIGTPEVKNKEGKVVQKATTAHPGISAVGSIFNPLTTRISGTDAANFKAYLDQVQGGAFLDAYNTLRGGGAITEVEGQKATTAVTRMNLAQSKDEFIKAAREYQEVLRKGIENAKNKSGIATSNTTTSGVTTSNW